MEGISELQRVTMTVRIRIAVQNKEWDSIAHKNPVHQTAKIFISII